MMMYKINDPAIPKIKTKQIKRKYVDINLKAFNHAHFNTIVFQWLI